MKLEELISDELWEVVKPLLPPPKPRRFKYPGRKPMDPRKALTGILYVLRSGIPWEMLPQELGCGAGMSCWRYLNAWQKKGIWKRIHKVLLSKLREADKIDFSRAVVDSSSVRAVLGGPKRGRTQQIAGKKAQNTTSSPKHRAFPLRSMSRRRTATT
jgi:transposase